MSIQLTNNPVIIRPALKRACCDNDACRAAVYNQLLFSIAWKVKHGCEYWYGTGEDIYNAMDQSWGLSKVNQELKALVKDHLIFQRRNPANGWDQTRQYLFREEEAQMLKEMCDKTGVCIHQMGFCADVLHLLNLTNAFGKNNKCICSIHQIDLVDLTNPFVKSNEAIPKVTTKDTSKVTEDTNVSSSDDAPSHQSEKEKKLEREVADLRAQIAHILQATDTPPFDTRPTPAGGNTTADEEKEPKFPDSSTLPEQTEVNFLDTAILEPPCNATVPLTQESATIPQSENAPSESPLQPQEMPSSTQAVDESNRQATEQGASNVSSSLIPVDTYPRNIGGLLHHSEIGGQQNQESISLLPDVGASNRASMVCDIPNTQLKQASGDDPIAGVTTNIFTELPFKDRPVEVKRNGRKVNPVNERVKWFYDVFTALGAEFFEDDTFKADYVYSKNDPMYKLIITYVSEGVSPYEMRMAFEHMWNEERDGQYFWQNPDTLTNRAFCKHLRSKISSAKFKIKQAERRASSNGSKNTPRASTAGSQYIVDELEEAALASIAAMEG